MQFDENFISVCKRYTYIIADALLAGHVANARSALNELNYLCIRVDCDAADCIADALCASVEAAEAQEKRIASLEEELRQYTGF